MFRRRKKGQEAQPKKSAPDLKGLAKFILDDDRGPPLRFVGRTAELKGIEALADQSVREGGAGLTHVITAAPGAGKTALLGELAERFTESGEARPVVLRAKSFSDPRQIIKQMFLALGDPAAERFGAVETETETQHAEGGVSAGVEAKAGSASGRAVQRETLPATFLDAFELLADRETPVVLLVDEAQLWGADDVEEDQWRSSLLIEAHMNQQRLPLLIVAAGLDDTRDVIAARGVSKLKTEEKLAVLGRLNPEEQRKVAEAFFKRFRITGTEALRAEWTEALIQGTDGWPRHLTNALRGAAKAIIEAEGDLALASLAAAQDSAEAYRRQYYADQLAPFEDMTALLEELVAALPEDLPEEAENPDSRVLGPVIKKAIARAYQSAPELAEEMPRAEVFTALRHKGLIQNFGEGSYACPIPSFKTYAEERCAAARLQEARLGGQEGEPESPGAGLEAQP